MITKDTSTLDVGRILKASAPSLASATEAQGCRQQGMGPCQHCRSAAATVVFPQETSTLWVFFSPGYCSHRGSASAWAICVGELEQRGRHGRERPPSHGVQGAVSTRRRTPLGHHWLQDTACVRVCAPWIRRSTTQWCAGCSCTALRTCTRTRPTTTMTMTLSSSSKSEGTTGCWMISSPAGRLRCLERVPSWRSRRRRRRRRRRRVDDALARRHRARHLHRLRARRNVGLRVRVHGKAKLS